MEQQTEFTGLLQLAQFVGVLGPVDRDGHPVERTKERHPYSYDAFVTWRGLPNEAATHAVYSDRLWQWDHAKHDALCLEHFGDKFQSWFGRRPRKVEAFLRDYLGKPDLALGLIMEGCNQGNGYPVWCFFYGLPGEDSVHADVSSGSD